MQLQTIRSTVRNRMGIGDADPLFSNAVLTDLINDSHRRLAIKEDWPWLESSGTVNTVAGTRALAVPAHRKVRWLRYEGNNITFTNYRNLADFDTTNRGVPYVYTEEAGTITLLPTPDAVYPIEYGILLAGHTTLTADTDVSLVPDWAIELIISDMGMLVSRRKRDQSMEKVYYAEFQLTYAAILDDILQTTEGFTPRRIGRLR